MRRREFITLLAGAAVTWPLTARAQQRERMRRVGLLMSTGNPPALKKINSVARGQMSLQYFKGHWFGVLDLSRHIESPTL
jgi:putative ABC transport system substrate-binding protein